MTYSKARSTSMKHRWSSISLEDRQIFGANVSTAKLAKSIIAKLPGELTTHELLTIYNFTKMNLRRLVNEQMLIRTRPGYYILAKPIDLTKILIYLKQVSTKRRVTSLKQTIATTEYGAWLRQHCTNNSRKNANSIETRAKLSNSLKQVYAQYHDEILQKIDNTKKRNGSYSTSKWQEYSKTLLYNLFGENDVECEYKTKEYPFKCDFYIKSLDLYIECHYCQYHNYRPFDASNKEHLREIKILEEKSAKLHAKPNVRKCNQYDKIIEVWTNLDIRKRQCALNNNLKWIAFYSVESFTQWLNKGDYSC